MFFIYAALIFVLLAVLYCVPLLQARRAVLPVLLIGKTGTPLSPHKDKTKRLSTHKLEKLLRGLKNKGFFPILPKEAANGTLPNKPVCIIFTGGYQNIVQSVLPLLEKYDFRAAVVLHAGLIGQYDAWQKANEGPWQNLLTEQDIKELQKTKRIEFVSSTVDGLPPDAEDDARACWQLCENKARLQNLYQVQAHTVYFPCRTSLRPAVQQQARQNFTLLIGNETGNNILPLDYTVPLRVFRISDASSLCRLFWKLTRL